MSWNGRLFKLVLLAGTLAAASLWGQSTSSITCPATASPGTAVQCTVAFALASGVAVDAGSIGLQVNGSSGAPATTAMTFTNSLSTAPFLNQGGTNFVSVSWNGISPQLTGSVSLGTVNFTVPATAVGAQTYTVSFNSGQPTIQCCGFGGSSIPISAGAPKTITVPTVLTLPAAGPLLTGTVGAPYSTTLTASGGNGPYTWSAPSLATYGLSISGTTATATISGTPTATASGASIAVTVKDSSSPQETATQTYTLTINAAPTISSPSSLPSGTVGTAYSQNVTATGGTAPYTWSATNLPSPLTIAGTTSTATIAGTPTAAANVTVVVKVVDANGASATKSYPFVINGPLQITSPANNSALPTATMSAAYTTTVVAAGGTPVYAWTIANQPAGLTINGGTGVIVGTPTVSGTFSNIQVTVTDQAHATVTNTYSLLVNPALTITGPSTLPAGEVNVAYPSTTITSGGGTAPITWSISGLPAGLTSSSGVISGTPTTAAGSPYTVTVTATDAAGAVATKTYSLTINTGLTITGPASPLPGATVNTPYSASITSGGGTAPFTWTNTTLPPGLNVSNANSATLTISGSPTATGPYSFTVTVKDSFNSTVNMNYSLTVNALPVVGGPASLPVATVSAPYTSGSTVTLTGGTTPITWSATGLPAGLAINASGAITGTASTNTGTPYTVRVTATDANGASSSQSFTLVVNPALVITGPASLPVAIPSVAYTSTTITASGGAGTPYTWSATGLPSGLTINASTGAISGTTTANSGSYTVVVTVADSNSVRTSRTYTLAVAPPLSITGPASLPSGTANVTYVATIVTATGGSTPYTWSATGLPAGLSINSSSGTIAGTPTAVGNAFNVTVTVTDGNGTRASMNYTIAVGALPLTMGGPPLPNGVINVPYPYTIIPATGGVGNYTWTITGLPPGLHTDGNGDISGTPTTTGSYTVVATVTDATQNGVSRTYTVVISGSLTVAAPTTPGLPTATLNSPYTGATITAGGGAAPYTWAATGLPPGMTIGIATGIIGGTPTSASGSPYSVTVTVTDSTGRTASMTYSLVVNASLTITAPSSLPAGVQNVAYTAITATATGGSGTYTWSIGGQPSGLTINATTGVISGTPAANSAGAYTVVVTVTDSNGATATRSYPLTIGSGPTNLPVIGTISTSAGGQSVVAPNTYVSLYGSNFAGAGFTDTWTTYIKNNNGNLPTTLDGVTVTAGGQYAYISYISATQINVLLPNVGLGPLQFVVTTTNGSSNQVMVNSQQYVPEYFEWPNAAGNIPNDSTRQPIATHLDYTYAAANGTFAGTTTVPAKPGETILLWGDGFGPTTPAFPFGVAIPTTATYNTSNNVTVTLNGAPITVISNVATLSPGFAGLFQMGVTIPASLANGTYPIIATINGVSSPTLTLTVHN